MERKLMRCVTRCCTVARLTCKHKNTHKALTCPNESQSLVPWPVTVILQRWKLKAKFQKPHCFWTPANPYEYSYLCILTLNAFCYFPSSWDYDTKRLQFRFYHTKPSGTSIQLAEAGISKWGQSTTQSSLAFHNPC